MLLQACLGVEIDGTSQTIHVHRPELPPGIQDVVITDLVVGEHRVDLAFRKVGDRVAAFLDADDSDRVSLQIRS